jgi:MtrB/PioB family decaheme-associated outer membrane protein
MRTRMIVLSGVLLVASAAFAHAQDTTPTATQAPSSAVAPSVTPKFGTIDFGYRGSSFTGDDARYNRLRDLRDGGYIDRFRYNRETEKMAFHAEADRVGYKDQRYTVNYQDIGRLKASFDWNSIPLFQVQANELFTPGGSGVLKVPDAVRQGIQNGTLTQLQAIQQFATPLDIKGRRDVANFNMVYSASRDVDLKVNIRNTERNGSNLFAMGFGSSPGNEVVLDLGVPVNDRTTDMKTQVEWANGSGLLSVGYDASWYNQHNPTFTWDNPLRFTDSATAGPAFGRTSLWPTNNANSMNISGSVKLPHRSRATATISYGTWNQNQSLLPNTTNTTLVSNPLERATAESKANVTSMLYGFSSRPVENLFLSAKYRFYDYSNKTPAFTNIATVADFSAGVLEESEPASMKRQTFDLDASVSPHKYLGFSAGYTRENGDRTFRVYSKTMEDVYRASIDSTANQYVTARVKYEYSKRTGDQNLEALPASEQAGMRQYDIAPRNRNRTTAILTITPVSVFDVNATLFTGRDKYPESYFGLRDNKNNGYSVGFDFIPTSKVNAGINFGRETFSAFQWSRTANPLSVTDVTFNDARRDWNLDTSDKVNTVSANVDFIKAIRKTDIRLSYDLSDGATNYTYGAVAGSTIPAMVQYTTQPRNRIAIAKVDGQYFIRPNVALGAAYWFEQYKVQDFAFDPTLLAPQALPFGLYSGYVYQPYKAHTGFIRMTYLW